MPSNQSFTVGFRIRELFVDSRKVTDLARKESLGALTRFGGYLRKTARSSLKPRKTSAMPGQPPTVWAASKVGQRQVTVVTKTGKTRTRRVGGTNNQVTLKNIQYGIDQSRLSLICGPVGLRRPVEGDTTLPQLMEFGGEVTREEYRVGTQWLSLQQLARFAGRGAGVRKGLDSRIRKLHYRPHPYMGPALDKTLEKLPGLWQATVSAA